MPRQERAKLRRLHGTLTELAERSGEPGSPPLRPSRITMLRASLAPVGALGRAFLRDPIGSLLRIALTVKVGAVVVVLVVVLLGLAVGAGK